MEPPPAFSEVIKGEFAYVFSLKMGNIDQFFTSTDDKDLPKYEEVMEKPHLYRIEKESVVQHV